jgi:hypothetical protein
VETVIVPNSFDMIRGAYDWEACALVPWAMHLPRDAGARDIETLLADKLRLEAKDISVTLHQPEPYLIRFENPDHAAAAMASNKGRFRGRGIDICLRRWRSLSHALGFRFFYTVKLCLDGIPDHAWTPAIVERVIGHRCTLQTIVTDLVQPEDSRHIELWSWTANPSEIPKRVWLTFTNQPFDDSSAVFVGPDPPPESWHQGARFEVFLHMPLMEDYSAPARDLQSVVDNPASITPIRRRFDWRYGLVDGAPPTARSRFSARLPHPPHDFGERDGHGSKRSAPRADHDDSALGRTTAERRSRERSGGDNIEGAGGRSSRGTDNHYTRGRDPGRDAHPARDSRDTRGRDKERARPRPFSSTCKNAVFTWPARCDDEDGNDTWVTPTGASIPGSELARHRAADTRLSTGTDTTATCCKLSSPRRSLVSLPLTLLPLSRLTLS